MEGEERERIQDYPALTSISKRLSMSELNRVEDFPLNPLSGGGSNVSRFRLFGDTLVKKGRSRSMDNLCESVVSTFVSPFSPSAFRDQRGGSGLGELRRFPQHELTDPFGHSYQRAANVDAFWKTPRRSSSIKLNLL